MKNTKTSAESSKATASKHTEARGSDEKVTSAKDAKKVKTTKDEPAKHKKPQS